MFVTGITERVELDGGEWIEIRKLSAKQLANAARGREREVAESVRAFGGDVMTAIQSARANGVTDTAVAVADEDPLNSHDRWMVLRDGITAWSDARKVNAPNIEELDEETSALIARRVLSLSLPSRDETARGTA